VVAVPIIASFVILAEEYWVRELEAAHQRRVAPDLTIPVSTERLAEPEPEREREPA
jgi:hypothetical protein